MPQVCADTFLVNIIGNLICTVMLKNKNSIKAVAGNTTITKVFLYTPGTGVNTGHSNFGFRADNTPSILPPGVTLTNSFSPNTPDVSGNLTVSREATYTGILTVDSNTDDTSIIVTIIFNPGIDI